MYWRIIRLASTPYFVLGTCGTNQMRLRVCTPWDWRQVYLLSSFRTLPDLTAGQPRVNWEASIVDLASSDLLWVSGHVEVRWSHGRFQDNPEAKVYLDTLHVEVPGYFSI
jgi:hypothetical protein